MDLIALILFFWARWLAKKPGAPAWLRYVGPALIINIFAALGLTILGLMHAFRSIGNVDAAHRSQRLAEGISTAMKFTAAGVVFDALVLVVLIVVTLRLRESRGVGP